MVEVALESLLRQWDDLAAWLRNEAQTSKTPTTSSATLLRGWRITATPLALPGRRLNDAEKLALQPQFARKLINAGEYLVSSRQAEDDQVAREKKRRNARIRTAV